jgi:hypothetical protein
LKDSGFLPAEVNRIGVPGAIRTRDCLLGRHSCAPYGECCFPSFRKLPVLVQTNLRSRTDYPESGIAVIWTMPQPFANKQTYALTFILSMPLFRHRLHRPMRRFAGRRRG